MVRSFSCTPILIAFATVSSLNYANEDTSTVPYSLPSSRPSVKKGWNLFTQMDWLYWKANETGLTYALNQDMFSVEDTVVMGYGEAANPKFDWESGFRVGVGYNIPHDQWDLALIWTWNEGKGSDSQHSSIDNAPSILPMFIHPNNYNDESIAACMGASYSALIHLNVLDLDLGRQFRVGKSLSLKPHFGIRSAWIHQTHDATYSDLFDKSNTQVLSDYYAHMTNNFWGIGPMGGFGAEFGIKWGLSFVGNMSASLLYGVFETTYSEHFVTNSGAEGTTISEGNSFHAGRAVLDLDLGLRWNRAFANERVRIVLQGGWEQHMFFSQNQIMHFVDGQSWGNFVQNQGDLYFQGWAASLRLFF